MSLDLICVVLLSAMAVNGHVVGGRHPYALANAIDDGPNWRLGKTLNEPPPRTWHAAVARYIVHKAEWTSMGTLSTLKSINGYPMVNIISVADSPRDAKSSGHIYFLLTDLDFTGQDLRKNNKLTTLFSNDQDLECSNNDIDPMEPTCGRIMISGSVKQLETNTPEYVVANESFVSRHPAAKNWIRAHDFYLCELEIEQIAVLNFYGGPHYVTPEEYYKANFDKDDEEEESDGTDSNDNNQRKVPNYPTTAAVNGVVWMPVIRSAHRFRLLTRNTNDRIFFSLFFFLWNFWQKYPFLQQHIWPWLILDKNYRLEICAQNVINCK